jgi:hypothetical protein
VNLNWKENPVPLQVLFVGLIGIGLILLLSIVAFWRSPLDAGAQRKANSTKTALALTAGSLLNPFPTSTAPTPTPSDTPTITSTIPTATPTVTRTPTQTPSLLPTFTPRTVIAHSTFTSIPIPTGTPRPPSTRTPVPPTNTPVIIIPTNTSVDTQVPTSIPPTDPPTEPPTSILPTIPIIQTLLP